jgi:hypothetical protein
VATFPAKFAALKAYAVFASIALKHAHSPIAPLAKVAVVKSKPAAQ